MNDYKKDDKLDKQTLDSFREIEINKILSNHLNKNVSRKKFRVNRFNTALSALLVVVLITVVALVYNSNSPSTPVQLFEVTQVSASEFKVESINGDEKFYFYYEAYVVHENVKLFYNETFDYNMQYDYVDETVVKNLSIKFEAFRLGEYRYFLKTTIDGYERIIEIDSFPALIKTKEIENLEFNDFENDLRTIFQLIEEYPPIYVSSDEHGIPSYQANPNIEDVEDQYMEGIYTAYVESFYEQEDYYGDEVGSSIETIFLDNIVILDDENLVKEDYLNLHVYSGAHVQPSETNDIVNYSFTFYPKNQDTPLGGNPTIYINRFNEDVEGKISSFLYDNKRYIYTMIDLEESSLDLSVVSEIKYSYRLHGIYDFDKTLVEISLTPFTYEGNLILGPIPVADEDNDRMISLFSYLKISFYNQDGELIYEELILDQYN